MKTVEKIRNGIGWKRFDGKGKWMPVIQLADDVDAWVLIEGKEYADPNEYPIISYLEKKQYKPLNLTDPIYNTPVKFYLFSFEEKRRQNNPIPVLCMKPKFVGYFCDIDQENGKDKEFCVISLPKITDQSILNEPNPGSNADNVQIYKAEFETLMKLLYRYRSTLTLKDPLFADTTVDPANELTLANRLGELYLKNGPYMVAESENNYHSGVTLWGQTVSRVRPNVIQDDTDSVVSVYYPRVIKKRLRRQETEITEIQKAVLNHLFYDKHYSSVLLIQPQVEKSVYSIEELKSDTHIINRLREEQLHTFSDDDWEMLELLIRFLSNQQKQAPQKIYAVTKYEHLFEAILGEYWGNQLSLSHRTANLTDVSFRSEYPDIGKIPDINCDDLNPIQWNIGKAKAHRFNNYNISVPDIVLDFQKQAHCMIIDAKYYHLTISDQAPSQSLTNHPGKSDVLKQLHYEEIFRSIYQQKHPDLAFSNIFVIPLIKDLITSVITTLDNGLLSLVGTVNVNYGSEIKKIQVMAVDVDQLVSKILTGHSHVNNNRNALLALTTFSS